MQRPDAAQDDAAVYLNREASLLVIRLPQSIVKRLDKLARRTGRSKSFHAREAIVQHLDDLEDLYLAERALECIRNGEDRAIPLEKIMKRHGMKE